MATRATNREVAQEKVNNSGEDLVLFGIAVTVDLGIRDGDIVDRVSTARTFCNEIRRAFERFLDERDREAR